MKRLSSSRFVSAVSATKSVILYKQIKASSDNGTLYDKQDDTANQARDGT